MAMVLPSTVEEINLLQVAPEPGVALGKDNLQAFENIALIERNKLKREVSLPNGVENWNIGDFDSYLNFEEDREAEDRLVPEGGGYPKRPPLQTSFSTVCVDSGSTCIADHSYYMSEASYSLDPEETYQNLDVFLQEVPDVSPTDTMSSRFSSASNDSHYEPTVLSPLLTFAKSPKRPSSSFAEDQEVLLLPKRPKLEQPDLRYDEIRRKNNSASKNSRKTRKEKQKEMEVKIVDLEKEEESLRLQVRTLEELIQAHKERLYAILQKR